MLNNLRFLSMALDKGLTMNDLTDDVIKTVADFGDLELICLCAKVIKSNHLGEFSLLINSVYKNASKDNIYWLDAFIRILENKGELVRNSLSMDINNLKGIKSNLENNVISRSRVNF